MPRGSVALVTRKILPLSLHMAAGSYVASDIVVIEASRDVTVLGGQRVCCYSISISYGVDVDGNPIQPRVMHDWDVDAKI